MARKENRVPHDTKQTCDSLTAADAARAKETLTHDPVTGRVTMVDLRIGNTSYAIRADDSQSRVHQAKVRSLPTVSANPPISAVINQKDFVFTTTSLRVRGRAQRNLQM
jgi:hypothetical protein